MTGIPPEAYKLLNMIAGVESPGYNVIYGGSTFGDYSDHPRKYIPITSGPNKGKKSSAAGRYQFIGSTWDTAAKAVGAEDFSPVNQDRAAWWLAQNDYKNRTGNDLAVDLRDPSKIPQVRGALAPTWEGLAKINDSKAIGMFDKAPDTTQNVIAEAAKGTTLNSNPVGPTVAAAASLPAAPAATGWADKIAGLGKNPDFMAGIGKIAEAVSPQQDSEASTITPTSIGSDGQQAAIAGSAASLMQALMQRRKSFGVPGMSLMG